MLIGMIGSWWTRRRDEVGRVSVMPARSIWIGALVLLVVAAVSMWTLMALYGGGSPQDKVQLEIVKLAGGIVVGTGGAAALLLAARRQRSTELQLAQNERDLAQKERAADDARHDAAERRITELYASSAEQLGSDKAPVRLAALHALERLGQDNPGHRQTVVDLLCAYLRMPFDAPNEIGAVQDEQLHEVQVRLTAQRLLTAHLRPETDSKFWAGMDLDLTRATLIEWDMAGCRVRRTLFDGTVFSGGATFQQAGFLGMASFHEAWFEYATSFGGARFHDAARFGAVTFLGGSSFREVEFGGAVSFDDTEFHDPTSFAGARFRDAGSFREVKFGGTVSFREVEFECAALFGSAKFREAANFGGTHFQDSASFGAAQFQDTVSFCEAEFHGSAWFDQAQLDKPDFSDARILAPDWATAQDWPRSLPKWRLTEADGEVPDDQQRRWHRFVPATPGTD